MQTILSHGTCPRPSQSIKHTGAPSIFLSFLPKCDSPFKVCYHKAFLSLPSHSSTSSTIVNPFLNPVPLNCKVSRPITAMMRHHLRALDHSIPAQRHVSCQRTWRVKVCSAHGSLLTLSHFTGHIHCNGRRREPIEQLL